MGNPGIEGGALNYSTLSAAQLNENGPGTFMELQGGRFEQDMATGRLRIGRKDTDSNDTTAMIEFIEEEIYTILA